LEDQTTEKQETKAPMDPDISKSVRAQEEHIETMPEPTLAAKKESKFMFFVMIVIVSMLCSVGTVAAYDRFVAQKVLKVNMKQYLEDQSQLYFAGKLTQDQLMANLDKYIATIKNQPKNRVVILEDVIASGAEKLNP